MDIRFSGKNLQVTEGMKDHLTEKLVRLQKYAPRLVESHVILAKQKYLYGAEITLLAKNLRAYGEANSKDSIYTAIDQAYLRIEKQLKKFREKVKDHHKNRERRTPRPSSGQDRGLERDRGQHGGRPSAVPSGVEGQSVEAPRPQIIPVPSFAPKPMSAEEASLQLRLSDKPFLIFFNASSQKANVIFKRDDGHHGLIEPK